MYLVSFKLLYFKEKRYSNPTTWLLLNYISKQVFQEYQNILVSMDYWCICYHHTLRIDSCPRMDNTWGKFQVRCWQCCILRVTQMTTSPKQRFKLHAEYCDSQTWLSGTLSFVGRSHVMVYCVILSLWSDQNWRDIVSLIADAISAVTIAISDR